MFARRQFEGEWVEGLVICCYYGLGSPFPAQEALSFSLRGIPSEEIWLLLQA